MTWRPPQSEGQLARKHESGLQQWKKGKREKKQRHRAWFQGRNGWKWTFGFVVTGLRCKKCGLEQNRYGQHRIILWKNGQVFSKHLKGWPSEKLTHEIERPCECVSSRGPSDRVLRIWAKRAEKAENQQTYVNS